MYDLYEKYKQLLLNIGLFSIIGGAVISGLGFINSIVMIIGGVLAGLGVMLLLIIGISEQTVSFIVGFGSVFLFAAGTASLVISIVIPIYSEDYNSSLVTALLVIGIIFLGLSFLIWIGRTAYLIFNYGFSYREPYKKAKTHYVTQRDARKTYSSDYNDDYDYND